MFSARIFNLLIFLVCVIVLSFGFYLQYVKGLEPCMLCLVQRLFFVLVAVVAFLSFIHNPKQLGIRVYAVITGLFAGMGAAVAGRQIWLQHLPADKVPECGPDLYFMLESYPLSEALVEILSGSGDCAKVSWTFLGFSIPEWSSVIFIGIFTVCVTLFIHNQRAKPVV